MLRSNIQLVVFDIADTTVKDNGNVADAVIDDISELPLILNFAVLAKNIA